MTPKPQSIAEAPEPSSELMDADKHPSDLKTLTRAAILLEGSKRRIQNRWINTQEAEDAKDEILDHLDPALARLEIEIQRLKDIEV